MLCSMRERSISAAGVSRVSSVMARVMRERS
jgi:hypothetical protein